MKFITCLALVFVLVFPFSSFAADCLEYEPKIVTLVGKIKKVTFPGPPNYESIKEGDEPEPYWILYLKYPICVKKNPNNEYTADEYNIRELQMLIGNYNKYRKLLGKTVKVEGMLTHAFTGHHHTTVMIGVRNISYEQTK